MNIKLSTFFILLLFYSNAHAEKVYPYIGGNMGFPLYTHTKFTNETSNTTANFNNESYVIYGLSVGVKFKERYALETEMLHSNFAIDNNNLSTSWRLQTTSFMFNGYAHTNELSIIKTTPFVMLGLGVSKNEADKVMESSMVSCAENIQDSFAWQAGVGAKFTPIEQITISPKILYRDLGKFSTKIDSMGNKRKAEVKHVAALVTILYNF